MQPSARDDVPAAAATSAAPAARGKIHPDVIKLGLVSFLTDLSSEMIFSVFAVFFTTVAGASSALLGLIEGLADFLPRRSTIWLVGCRTAVGSANGLLRRATRFLRWPN